MQQQQVRRLAYILGISAMVTGGLFAVACGTDNGTTGDVPTPSVDSGDGTDTPTKGKDSGTPSKDSGGTTPDDDGGPTTDDDAGPNGADCSKAPILRDNTKGFYCPFIAADAGPDGGGGWFCGNDETCCTPAKNGDGTTNPGFCADAKGGAAECKTYAAAHAADGLKWPEVTDKPGSSWECLDNVACGGAGNSCCLFTGAQYTDPKDTVNVGKSQDDKIPASCNAKQAFKEGGTHCVTGDACPAGDKLEIKLCSLSDKNCPNGTTCTPFNAFYKRDMGYCR